MLKLDIPGDRIMELAFLILDYNGTIAGDGRLFTGVKDKMIKLSESISLHVLTADVATQSIGDALDLLCNPLRLAATLRM